MTRTSVVQTRVPYGMQAVPVRITATPAPRLAIHGLSGDPARREATVRVEQACRSAGVVPGARVTVECQVPVRGYCDLAIALAALDVAGQLRARTMPEVYGSLAMDGRLQPVRGLYSVLRSIFEPFGDASVIVPESQSDEAGMATRDYLSRYADNLWSARTLDDVVRWFAGAELPRVEPRDAASTRLLTTTTRAPVELPWEGKGPAVLLVGEPGSGLMLQARARASALPEPSPEALRAVRAVWSVAGVLVDHLGVAFRAPHHTVSDAGLVGSRGRPGEVSLAHGGCLLLDEVADFRRSALQALTHAMSQGVAVTPDGQALPPSFPARPQLVIGTCAPKDVKRARELFTWTGEIEVPRVNLAELVQ